MFKHLNFNLSGEAKKRLLTSFCIIVGLTIAFALRMISEWIFDVFIFVMVVAAVIDVMGAKKLSAHGVKNYYVFAYLLISYSMFIFVMAMDFAHAFWLHVIIQVVAIAVFALYTFLMNYTDKEVAKAARLKKTTLGSMCRRSVWEFIKIAVYPAIILLTLVPLNHMGSWATVALSEGAIPVEVTVLGLFSLLLVFVISCFTDTCAYLVGMSASALAKQRGKEPRKLCPKISPKKTWAGFIGGLFGGVLGTLLLLLIFSTNGTLAAFLTDRMGNAKVVQLAFIGIGIAGSIINQAGDIYASWLKRKVGIKDFGRYLPGHGGAMDRLDGISWNAAFIFITMMLVTFVC